MFVGLLQGHVVRAEEVPLPLCGGERDEHHENVASDQFRRRLGVAHAFEILADLRHEAHAEFLVRHLASAELQEHADLVALVQKFLGVAHLRLVVVRADVHAELDLLHLRSRVLLLLLLVLGKLILELAEIHDAADRRHGVRRDFHEVEAEFHGLSQSVLEFHHPELFTGGRENHTHFFRADSLIDSNGLELDGLVSFGPHSVEHRGGPFQCRVALACDRLSRLGRRRLRSHPRERPSRKGDAPFLVAHQRR